MKRVNTGVRPPRAVRQRRTARQAVGKFWSTANRQHRLNLDAASIILGDVARYGGESARLVRVARYVVKRPSRHRRDIGRLLREVEDNVVSCPTCESTGEILWRETVV